MLKIGLTGGIASGKSLLADTLAELGAKIIDTDLIAREVVTPGETALQEISATFGTDMLRPDGTLDRSKLRERVFKDARKKQQLEAILHPRIRERTLQAVAATATADYPYLVIVVPLLVETDFGKLVDRVLVVDTDPELQRQRVALRDGISEADAELIINQQATREERLQSADDVIENNGSRQELRAAAAALHAHYLELARDHLPAKH